MLHVHRVQIDDSIFAPGVEVACAWQRIGKGQSCMLAVLVIGLYPQPFIDAAMTAARSLLLPGS